MKLREKYKIENQLYQEALNYAESSKQYTSNRHDFHAGGLDNKSKRKINQPYFYKIKN